MNSKLVARDSFAFAVGIEKPIKKAVENPPVLREMMAAVVDNYLDVQQDILETFVNRGELGNSRGHGAAQRQADRRPETGELALMHALVRFANVAAGNAFTTAELYEPTLNAVNCKGMSMAWARFATICLSYSARQALSQHH